MRCSFEETDSHGNRWAKPWTVKFMKYILNDRQWRKTCSFHCWYRTVCSFPYFVLLSGARTKIFFLLWLLQLIQLFPRLNYSFLIPFSEICKARGRDKDCAFKACGFCSLASFLMPLCHLIFVIPDQRWLKKKQGIAGCFLFVCFSFHGWVKVGEEHWTVEGA